MTTDERLKRLEQAVAENTRWAKGDWRGSAASQSAAGTILQERRTAEAEQQAVVSGGERVAG
jgi:hypothetical protein